ncbi:hypothetical protein FJV82_24885 [Mesorhizobium sp. WSM4305]|nr:hypothetical protein FJV82_24885 [Mesorhizobium sp. WSM4305]
MPTCRQDKARFRRARRPSSPSGGGRGGAAKQRRSGGRRSSNAPPLTIHHRASIRAEGIVRLEVTTGESGRPPLRRASLDTSPPIDGGEERRGANRLI